MSMIEVHDELVRDRIPDIIEGEGLICRVVALDEKQFRDRLRAKLDEEIAEFDQSGSVEELADILEVLDALAESQGVDAEWLNAMRLSKREERGGFDRRLLLIDVRS
jgi:predicted house-cleaning noncanonical NTP pyrophosphatase (MazG superfamily)